MSRKNEERFQATPPAPSPGAPPPNIPRSNSGQQSLAGFSFVVPTEFVELPSKGRFYPPDHALHNVETIEIKYMTAKEEDILASPALMRAGQTLDRLVESVLLDRSIRPDEMLIGDKNAILVASRITGYGDDYAASIICRECFEPIEHKFKLNLASRNLEGDDYEIDPQQGLIFTTLPVTKIQIAFRPLVGTDDRRLDQMETKRTKHGLTSNRWIDTLNMIIASADGTSDPSTIAKFIEALPAKDSRHLRSVYNKATPDVELKTDVTCPHCSAEFESEVPITGEFFWPE